MNKKFRTLKILLCQFFFVLFGYGLAVIVASIEDSVCVQTGRIKSTFSIYPFKIEKSRNDTAFNTLYNNNKVSKNTEYSIFDKSYFFSFLDRKSYTKGSTIRMAERLLVKSFIQFELQKRTREEISLKFQQKLIEEGDVGALKYALAVWENNGNP